MNSRKPPEERKVIFSCKLHPKVVEILKNQTSYRSQAAYIEEAVKRMAASVAIDSGKPSDD